MERRTQYRVGGDGFDDTVQVYLSATTDGRGRIEADLADLSVSGAQVRCIIEARVPTHVGGEMTLWVVDRPSRLEVALRGRVVHRREELSKRVFGLKFLDPRVAEGLLVPPLSRLFNKRAAFRVVPEAPVEVTVVPPRETRVPIEVGLLVDLSSGGLGVDLAGSFEVAMTSHDRVEVLFRLPGLESPVALPGRVRHRSLRPDGTVRYGIMFNEPDTATYRSFDAILGYVARRQKEMTDAWVRENQDKSP